MNIKIQTRKITLNDAFREKAEAKLKKLDKFFPKADAILTVSEIKEQMMMELTVKYQSFLFRAEKSAYDKYEALDACIDTIIRQMRKNKTKLEKRLYTGPEQPFAEYDDTVDESDSKVVKYKKFAVKPMDVEEAVLQMELLGHSFFMFRNVDSDAINVVYRRNDGQYAVIEPEE